MPGQIPQSFIQDLLSQTDIIEILSTRIQLKKRGNHYLALCPFHQEKTPSFSVSAEKQFYYCFGCKAHGNAINFLMSYDRMEFIEAIEYLAAQRGLEIPTQQNQITHTHQPLYQLMQKAAYFYQKTLRQSPIAIQYLKERGLTGETAKTFAIGYVPDSWDALLNFFNQQPNIIKALEQCGMIIANKQRRYYDRFRSRIIFPIRDTRGRVVAFGGRTLTNQQPKYINSPETLIFHKNQELYGLYEARQCHKTLEQVVIVEGYMDVISLYQHGITFTVATLGTAINAKHIQKLLRYTQHITFCFDGDTAGQQAAWKALTLCLPLLRDGIHIDFLFLPKGEDPDSWVRAIGPEAFRAKLAAANALPEVFFSIIKNDHPLTTPEHKAEFGKKASEHLNTMPNGLYKKLLYQQLAAHLHMSLQDLEQLQQQQLIRPTNRSSQQIQRNPAMLACSLLLNQPTLASQVLDMQTISQTAVVGGNLLKKLIQIYQKQPNLPTGQLLSLFDNAEEQHLIAYLVAHKPPIPRTGFQDEFLGALSRLAQHNHHQTIQKLIQKGKQHGLSAAEKQQLQQLLTMKSQNPNKEGNQN